MATAGSSGRHIFGSTGPQLFATKHMSDESANRTCGPPNCPRRRLLGQLNHINVSFEFRDRHQAGWDERECLWLMSMLHLPDRTAVRSLSNRTLPNISRGLCAAMTVLLQLAFPYPILQSNATTLVPRHSPSIAFQTEDVCSIGVPYSERDFGSARPKYTNPNRAAIA
jgi:hypothetical protein